MVRKRKIHSSPKKYSEKIRPLPEVLADRGVTYVTMLSQKAKKYLMTAYGSGNVITINEAEGKLEKILEQIPEIVEGVSLPSTARKRRKTTKIKSYEDYEQLRELMTHEEILGDYGKSKKLREQLRKYAISYTKRHRRK